MAGMDEKGIGTYSRRILMVGLGAMTFFVFFPASAGAGIIATNLLMTTLNGSLLRSGSGLAPAVQI